MTKHKQWNDYTPAERRQTLITLGVLLVVFYTLISTCSNREFSAMSPEQAAGKLNMAARGELTLHLLAPSEAVWPNAYSSPRFRIVKDSLMYVYGHVDAQNAYGATVRTKWTAMGRVWLSKDGQVDSVKLLAAQFE